MGGRKRGEVGPELARARDRFRCWRRTRRPKSRIPEPLWAVAVQLAAVHGVHRTAETLRLDYYSLKRRVEASDGRNDSAGRAFIELPPAVPTARECAIEFEDGTGVSRRVQLKGYDVADVVAVGKRPGYPLDRWIGAGPTRALWGPLPAQSWVDLAPARARRFWRRARRAAARDSCSCWR